MIAGKSLRAVMNVTLIIKISLSNCFVVWFGGDQFSEITSRNHSHIYIQPFDSIDVAVIKLLFLAHVSHFRMRTRNRHSRKWRLHAATAGRVFLLVPSVNLDLLLLSNALRPKLFLAYQPHINSLPLYYPSRISTTNSAACRHAWTMEPRSRWWLDFLLYRSALSFPARRVGRSEYDSIVRAGDNFGHHHSCKYGFEPIIQCFHILPDRPL